ncbi:MAG: glycine--tRNA ligase subunit beta [Nitrospirae bacterium]|nr:glycine--tRNA ligase subunit beta [Nitrospirota bacterium]
MPQNDSAGPSPSPERLSSLLLELGTEEIPARFLPPALTLLRTATESLFVERLIGFSEIKTYATPRRLTALVKGIPRMQQGSVREVFGPSKKVAFDASGNPTKAATGFARSQGVEVTELVVRTTDKGEYVAAVIRQEGVEVRSLLPDVLKKMVLSLSFPKSMRWGNGNLRFVRPLRWILALLDSETIPFEIDGIRSANITKGHRFLSPGSFTIREIPSYVHLLENNYVIVDQVQRRKVIETGIDALAATVGGKVPGDEGLLETVTHLVEYPVPVLCEFPAEYLRLPWELLITVMKGHQKYFAVEGEAGTLRNYFVVVSNTKDENAETIRKGAERVIKARFEDARFYYEEDISRRLETRIEDLKRVTFHDRLGSLHEKTERIVRTASFLAGKLAPEKKGDIERAAWLSKTDLLTGVVGEFPELQGLMGRYYALHDGERKEVAEALREQYLPSYSGDRLPESDEGAILSLADKMDTIVSFFAIGLMPTGSEDPFALRRQALGVIAILIEKGYPVALGEIVRKLSEGMGETRQALASEVLAFFMQRIEPLFSSQGYEPDIVLSVIHLLESVPLGEILARIHAVRNFGSAAEYTSFLMAMKRINNIVPETELPSLNNDLLSEPQEKALCGEMMNIRPVVRELLRGKKYYDVLKLTSALSPFINSFFDKVLVMDKKEEVKLNRLSLLREIWSLVSPVADLSKLKETR